MQKNAESMFRASAAYKLYKSYLIEYLGINRCQVFGNVTVDDAKRELLPENERYCVIQTGGSIGEQSSFNYRLGGQACRISRDNMTAE